jgi:peptide chain release factor 2
MLSQQELSDYVSAAKQILDTVNLAELNSTKLELETGLAEESTWSNPKLSAELNQKLSSTNKSLDQVKNLNSQLSSLEAAFELEMQSDFEKIKQDLDTELELFQNQKFLNGQFDQQGAFVSLYAGAGGIDAQDWTAMLCAMYQSFCKSQNWSCSLMAISIGEEAGLKSATLEIKGENVYGFLKEEAGVHRLVRISPFNSGGTRETSFAMVEVIPNNLNSQIEIQIDEKDLRIDTFMSGGKGGQGVNTTYSAVRIVHLPTNISVQCQDERSQILNKERAMSVLKNKLAALELKKQKEFQQEIRGNLGQNEWGSQIRSYTLHPYKLVKDHRSGWETGDVNKVLEQGEILPIIWSVKKLKVS